MSHLSKISRDPTAVKQLCTLTAMQNTHTVGVTFPVISFTDTSLQCLQIPLEPVAMETGTFARAWLIRYRVYISSASETSFLEIQIRRETEDGRRRRMSW